MELTLKQLNQVKQLLDGATWTGQVSHPDRYPEDGDKACRYLQGQRFSHKAIKSFVADLDVVDVYEQAKNEVDNVPTVCASMIADGIAMDRVRRFLHKRNGKPGNGWYLPESWVFEIVG